MTNSNKPHNIGGYQSIVAGTIAGCVTRSCTSPLDVLKIIIQVNGAPTTSVVTSTTRLLIHNEATSLSSLAAQSSAKTTSVILGTFRHLYKNEGLKGFWKGNFAGCCRLGPYSGAKFFIFDFLQSRFLGENPTNAQRASCGAVAGLIGTMATYPMEVVRTRIITQNPHNPEIRGVFHGVQTILKSEGIAGLYRGGLSGIIGAIPFEGVQFGCYEYLKRAAIRHHWPQSRWPQGKTEPDCIDYFLFGSISGAVAQTIAYPFDTVKKRLQTQVRSRGKIQYCGVLDCFRKVIQEEGLLALYRGTVANLARIVPYAAVMFSTYETTKKTLVLLSESQDH
jgi:solute carrier family 25 protein 43